MDKSGEVRQTRKAVVRLVVAAALATLGLSSAQPARADTAACVELVSKLRTLEPLGRPTATSVHASATGGTIHTRIATDWTPGSQGTLMSRLFTTTLPSDASSLNWRFHMSFDSVDGGTTEVPFASTSLRGLSAEVINSRKSPPHDSTAFAITTAGALQWASLTWNRGVNNVDVTDCVAVGNNIFPAGAFPGANLSQRTLPTVVVTGRRTFAGYGTDVYQLVVVPGYSRLQ